MTTDEPTEPGAAAATPTLSPYIAFRGGRAGIAWYV
jgi:hypothetical protein